MDYFFHNSNYKFRKRMLALLTAICFIFGGLGIRIGYIQLVQGSWLRNLAEDQWHRELSLAAPRGRILDANGTILVDNKYTYAVYVRPRSVTDIEGTAAALASKLDVDAARVAENIRNARQGEITIARRVPVEKADAVRQLGLDGVFLAYNSTRNYPGSSSLSRILGLTNIDNVGQNGIEGYYDRYLRGLDGMALTPTDLIGIRLPGRATRYLPAVPGNDVTLTVDYNIQSFAESAVAAAHAEWSAVSARMLIMDAVTGGIVALAESPTYDLNEPPRHDIDLLNALSKSTLMVDVYEPGSTFKIFTTAGAIESGVVNMDRDRFSCPGFRIVDGQRIRCWRSIGHGTVDLLEGVQKSCNCVFMDLAQRMGTQPFYNHLRNFGFGTRTGIDFFGESPGIMIREKDVKTIDLVRIGFGQAVAVTALQLVAATAAVVNGGNLVQPHFMSRVAAPCGTTVYAHNPQPARRVLSPSTSATMRGILENVVANGSGSKAQVEGFRVGGKTGTAQKYRDGVIDRGRYVSSFVGFGPVNDPRYVVLMIVDEPSSYLYYGSLLAAPYAGRVLGQIFEYKDLTPTEVPVDIPIITMPDLIGMPLIEAVRVAERLGLRTEIAGEGGVVLSTVPSPNNQVRKGHPVLLRAEN